MIPGPKALLAAVALLSFSAACSWSQPPRIQDAILPPMAVQDPLFKRSTGKIFLLPHGLWNLTLDDEEHALHSMQPGDLIGFDAQEDAELNRAPHRHIFAIITKNSWGFVLQRLDSQPITRKSEGTLTPISNLNADDICSGTTALSTDLSASLSNNECLTETPLSRFDIYAITQQNSDDSLKSHSRLVVQNKLDSNTLAMPIMRRALLYTGAENTPKIFAPAQLPERWIAIRATQTALTPDQITIASDDTCPTLENTESILNGLTVHHIRLTKTLPNLTHPLEIEAAAFEHAADSLLWCSKDATNVATPAIHHPVLSARAQYILGSSILGLRPIQISADPKQRALLAQVSALSARNHNELADFALEILLQSQAATTSETQQLAIQSMQLTASAGRPEAALRHGWLATNDTWNREGDPLYMLGQAAAFAAFDLNAEYTKRIQQFSKTLQSANDPNLVAWLVYDDFRRQIATGNQIPLLQFEEVEKNLVKRKLDTWAIALRALALQHEIENQNTVKPAAIEILQKAFQDRNMAAIWTAYIPQNTAISLDCPSKTPAIPTTACPLDSFGRRLAKLRSENPESLVAQLRTAPRIDLHANFDTEHLFLSELAANPSLQARLILAAFPLLSAHDKSEILPLLSQSLANIVAMPDEKTCKDLAQIQAIGRELDLRASAPDNSPEARTAARNAAWLANDAFPAACQSIAKFEATVREYTQQSAAQTNLITPFFDSLLVRNIDAENDNSSAARSLAQLTTEIGKDKLGHNEPCRRFNLALAAALARSGQLADAQKHLLLSGKCAQPGDKNHTKSYNLILNYISYERSGHWTNGQPTSANNNRCAPLEDTSFNIIQHLEPEIALLAAHFQIPTPEPSTGFLQLRNASSAIAQGEASYQVARRNLSEGRPQLAAKLLSEARTDFASSSYFAGLARVEFLEQLLFEKDLDTFAQSSQPASPRLQTDKAVSQNLIQLPAAKLPSVFRTGQARIWLQQFDAATPEERTKIPAHLLISASLLVEELSQTFVRLQSIPEDAMTQPLTDFCTPSKT